MYWLWIVVIFIIVIALWFLFWGKKEEFIGITLEEIENLTGKKLVAPEEEYKSPNRKSKGEKLCCEIMSRIFDRPFKTVRPNFLKNPETGRNLEIDCYNEELRLGVEYNGIQHYHYPNFTGMSKEEFYNQLRRDRFKREACDAHGVYLITVPYTVKHEDIEKYIRERLP